MSSASKKSLLGRDSEQAPLLADDAPDRDDDSVGSDGGGGNSKRERVHSWLTKAWHWLSNNIMVVAIILLLIGGIIALCVYFAGVFAPRLYISNQIKAI